MAALTRSQRVILGSALALGAQLACGEGSGMIGVITNDTTGTGGTTSQLLASVQVNSNAFSPTLVNLGRGGTVVWIWADTTSLHNVTFNNSLLSSTTKSSGSHTVTFQTAGTFNYACTQHPGMTGSIVVR